MRLARVYNKSLKNVQVNCDLHFKISIPSETRSDRTLSFTRRSFWLPHVSVEKVTRHIVSHIKNSHHFRFLKNFCTNKNSMHGGGNIGIIPMLKEFTIGESSQVVRECPQQMKRKDEINHV
ncbi:MAG: hypothetical protein B6D34_10680 [Candidatus Brocadia sp. UTAMX1]|jgi:hypothetical protein|nr:MAG: hypothetical protein B6D34_10680 [Candidatus Brocadia sp. UTAMX1]